MFVTLVAPDQLLLSESVCHLLSIVSYHPSVQPVQRGHLTEGTDNEVNTSSTATDSGVNTLSTAILENEENRGFTNDEAQPLLMKILLVQQIKRHPQLTYSQVTFTSFTRKRCHKYCFICSSKTY